MRAPRYLSAKEVMMLISLTHIPLSVYLVPLILFIRSGQASWVAGVVGYLAILLTLNWKVNVGEEGHVLILGFDTKGRVGPGNYPMPSFLPFLRGWDITLGVSVEVPSSNHEGNLIQLRQFRDQRSPSYIVNAQTGLVGLLVGQILSNTWLWFRDTHEPNGKFRYYKFGTLLYLCTWVYALAAH